MYLANARLYTNRGVVMPDTSRIISCMTETWADRARRRMKELDKTQEDLVKPLGVKTRGAVGHYFRGRRNLDQNQVKALASELRCSTDWLLTGKGPVEPRAIEKFDKTWLRNIEPGPEISGSVPLISWVQAGNWTEIMDIYQPGDGEEWIMVARRVGPHAFALRIHGDSMTDEFAEGDIVIVDPDREAENKSYVIVRLDDQEEATFKQIIRDGGKTYLKPLNPRYPIIELNGQKATICGVVVQKTKVY